MVAKVLIAERTEVASRIARTCRRLGITAVAVHAEHESQAAHVEACDEAVAVPVDERGAVSPSALVETAKRVGADAIHPGYARPRAHAALGRAAVEAGISFLGAGPDPLELSTDRLALRAAAERADVRFVPGVSEPVEGLEGARAAGNELGYPIVLKSRHIGTRAGTFRVDDEDDLAESYAACRRACADRAPTVSVVAEKRLNRPRLLDITVVHDRQGGLAAIGEREASIRHDGGGLLVECPSPDLVARSDGEAVRDALADAAIRVTKELGVTDVVSVRFLLDPDRRYWLVGAVPGLPSPHAVVEMVMGLDLVELQLRSAAGEALEDELGPLQGSGHAIEAEVRTSAAPPEPAEVTEMRWPPAPQGRLRVEPSVHPGSIVADSGTLLLKTTSYAPVRHQALLSLDRILAATVVRPLETNVPLLRAVLADEALRAGQYDTELLERLA